MFAIIIQEKGGEQRRMVFNKPEVTIGRVQGNDIVLPKGNVSKRHARIVLKDGKFIIVDLKSTNGTYVNGRKITSPLVVKESDKIYIGDFIVGVDESNSQADVPGDNMGAAPVAPTPPPPQQERPPAPRSQQMQAPMPPGGGMGGPMSGGGMGGPMGSPMGGPGMGGPGPGMGGPGPGMGGPGMGGPGPGMGGPGMGGPGMGGPMGPGPGMGGPGGMGPGMGGPGMGGPGMGGPMGPGPGMDDMPPPRTIPPRPSPGPGGPGAPMGAGPPRDLAGPTTREPMPPLNPPGEAPRTRPPRPAPGGTLPPPISPLANPLAAPIPAPSAPAAVPTTAEPPAIAPATNNNNNRPRLVGVGVKPGTPRPVAAQVRRGVHVEPLDPKVVKMLDLQTGILERLRAKLDLDKIPVERLGDEDLWQKAERAIVDLVETLESSGELPKYIDQETLIKETLNEALGLGPLEDLLADEKVDEIIVDRRDRIVVGKDGALRGSGKAFSSDDVLRRVVTRLVAPTGRWVAEDQPVVDVRLRDGSRLTAAVPPVATHGACFVLRKPRENAPSLADLVGSGSVSPGMADFLATCVAARRNLLVCGGASSGKTTVVAALASATPPGERIVSIEEVGELALKREDWVALETWPGNNKHPAVDLTHLVQSAFRMRPDRLVVGELRGAEALDVITALGASIDGAIAGVAGEGAQNALARVATLARLGNGHVPEGVARELAATAFDIVVHVTRMADGNVRVTSIDEVLGGGEGGFDTQTIFHLHGNAHAAAGVTPRFYAELESRGIRADAGIFR
jgi:pilus assembly protein CpaF